MDTSAPTQNQPSMPLEGQEGQAMTGSAGASMHQCHIPEFDQVQPRPRTTSVHLGSLGLLGSPSVS